ncbi:hypothetical protein N9937_00250 [bacterium]|nr:hypothetical protein [bacterium]
MRGDGVGGFLVGLFIGFAFCMAGSEKVSSTNVAEFNEVCAGNGGFDYVELDTITALCYCNNGAVFEYGNQPTYVAAPIRGTE